MNSKTNKQIEIYDAFISAGRQFFETESENDKNMAGVRYVINEETGEMAIFTRGEYRESLRDFIKKLNPYDLY
ncbi:MAG: hypothetical protein MJA83_10190 [Gammaproteobacteria bacterium]|nr:hypothetical protein [Gammaproteobacteria bacterium]